jgi:UDP-4-amino-4,6-dideoxy-N-acetyl-beta-L-altrosamine transaminase
MSIRNSESWQKADSRMTEEGGPGAKFVPFASPLISDDEIAEVVDTLKSGWLTTGPKVQRFEKEFAQFVGSKYAIAVSSCTAALHLALVATGIGPGDEVITTPFTFVATANVILHVGAKPIFVDIRPDTFNIDVEKISAVITPKTRAIIPVHYAGQPCEMDEIMEIATKHKLLVIEDAAHAIAAEYKGRKVGTIGDVTCFSFYATKNLMTGEGGMVTTNHAELAEKIRILSLHGMSKDAWKRYTATGSWYYEVLSPGYKYNMTDIQASLGIHQLQKLEIFQKRREEIVKAYNQAFAGLDAVVPPFVQPGVKHAWHLYVIKIVPERLKIDRNRFIEALKEEGVGTSVHFIPVHLHPYYREKFGFKRGDFPRAEEAYDRVISLPLYPKMSDEDVGHVIEAVRKVATRYKK